MCDCETNLKNATTTIITELYNCSMLTLALHSPINNYCTLRFIIYACVLLTPTISNAAFK